MGKGNTTTIARGVKVEGEFTSQGDVLIEGEVHGTLATSGLLTVGPEAKIKADVAASEAVISGTIEGNIVVTKRLEIKSTANITGDITAETASIESGAIIAGRAVIGKKALSTADRPVTAPVNARRERSMQTA